MEKITLSVDSNFMSPYALAAYVALTEKELPFEVLRVDLGVKEHHERGFRDRSLTARVPMLVHRGFALTESSAITEYLDEVFPAPLHRPLYPRNPERRARARQVQAWIRSDLMPIRVERSTSVIFVAPNPQPLSAEARAAADKLLHATSAWLSHGGENLFGEWCIADTDLGVMLNRLVMNGDEVPPAIAVYAKRQWARPSVQSWVARQQAVAKATA
jgi:glutathione S-transferase